MNTYILTMHALRGPLAVALESMLLGYDGINTLDELVAVIRSGGHRLAEYMDSNECRRGQSSVCCHATAALRLQGRCANADRQAGFMPVLADGAHKCPRITNVCSDGDPSDI